MKTSHTLIATAVAAVFAVPVWAQSTTTPAPAPNSPAAQVIQRDVNQQQRIENGLQSGSLTTREASQLEKRESRVDRMESRDLRDGTLSPQEQAQINRAQNRVSRDIYRDTHNNRFGNPSSASSQRMQADVQRNVNQEQRIERGVQSGQLTNREAGQLEHGQARVDRLEWRDGRDGHVGRSEERRIQSAENHQGKHIYQERHDGQSRHFRR